MVITLKDEGAKELKADKLTAESKKNNEVTDQVVPRIGRSEVYASEAYWKMWKKDNIAEVAHLWLRAA